VEHDDGNILSAAYVTRAKEKGVQVLLVWSPQRELLEVVDLKLWWLWDGCARVFGDVSGVYQVTAPSLAALAG
jgi:hypothetical protein